MKYSKEEEAEITDWNGNVLNLLCGWVLTDKRKKKKKESICVALEGFICSPGGALGKDPLHSPRRSFYAFVPTLDKLSIYRGGGWEGRGCFKI